MINYSILYLLNIEVYQEGLKLEIQYMGGGGGGCRGTRNTAIFYLALLSTQSFLLWMDQRHADSNIPRLNRWGIKKIHKRITALEWSAKITGRLKHVSQRQPHH